MKCYSWHQPRVDECVVLLAVVPIIVAEMLFRSTPHFDIAPSMAVAIPEVTSAVVDVLKEASMPRWGSFDLDVSVSVKAVSFSPLHVRANGSALNERFMPKTTLSVFVPPVSKTQWISTELMMSRPTLWVNGPTSTPIL